MVLKMFLFDVIFFDNDSMIRIGGVLVVYF